MLESAHGFAIDGATGRQLSVFYRRDDSNPARHTRFLTIDEARQMAVDFARLPESLKRTAALQERIFMPQKIKMIAPASAALSGLAFTPVMAAEREQVRAVINLIAAVKMPFPEGFERDVARTEYVRLDGRGETVACVRVDDKVRWCYEHIPALGSRAEMLRIRNEPVEGIQVGQLLHYVVDYDLDGLADVGSTTRMEPPPHAPVAAIAQFFHRGTGRGDQFRTEYQKLYDDGIQVALKYLGE
jgi:hypothetical protein